MCRCMAEGHAAGEGARCRPAAAAHPVEKQVQDCLQIAQ